MQLKGELKSEIYQGQFENCSSCGRVGGPMASGAWEHHGRWGSNPRPARKPLKWCPMNTGWEAPKS
jgi:hypothetical protein